jgi:ribosomal-protein-alanine N-acetyltransferase
MKLIPININEDKTQKIFASEDCQQVLNTYESYYPRIGFAFPWIGYFILHDDTIVGSCGFTGKPINEVIEIAYYTKDEELLHLPVMN